MDNLYDDQLGEIEANGSSRDMWATALLLADPENVWWDDVTTQGMETRDEILLRSLSEGYEATVAVLGPDRERWRWGNLHTATFVSNPLGVSGIDVVEDMVNRGPVMTSGGTSIVNATGWRGQNDLTVRAVPSFRMIVDVGDWTNSVNIHTTGQSGHSSSEHYGDMIDTWRNIEYKPMLFTRAQVEAATKHRLILKPS
jgi:penicillin G amidase